MLPTLRIDLKDIKDSLSSTKSKKAFKIEVQKLQQQLNQSLQREKETNVKLQNADQNVQSLRKQIRQLQTEYRQQKKTNKEQSKELLKQKGGMEALEAQMKQMSQEKNQAVTRAVFVERKLDNFKAEVWAMLNRIRGKLSQMQGSQEEFTPLMQLASHQDFTFDTANLITL
eukprot:TRINITY_DN5633_c0_g1_i10.p4 TRINITY_DN5633_c0_g1~~TRINITY_DN5633_c0_g1_i10.p4  ORF type:complete len:171 (-),score=18.72 TRINITY_DN5633_c0_g1_i10:1625-2137(-)